MSRSLIRMLICTAGPALGWHWPGIWYNYSVVRSGLNPAWVKGLLFTSRYPTSHLPVIEDDKRSATRETERDWSEKTILVAEDTESNYLYIEELLSLTNARLIRAKDGLEAIEIFRANKDSIDLIFMDILMPEYDGFEATQLIRKIKKDIPVIAQTAFTFEGEMENGLYAGCFDDYVLKPFNIKVIYKLLEKYLFATP